jgi:hypothetical protein
MSVNRRTFGNDLFRRKVIITLPPWGVPAVALIAFASIALKFQVVANMVAFGLSIGAFTAVMAARKQVRHMKYEAARAISVMADDEEMDRYESHVAQFPVKKIETANNHASPFVASLPKQ